GATLGGTVAMPETVAAGAAGGVAAVAGVAGAVVVAEIVAAGAVAVGCCDVEDGADDGTAVFVAFQFAWGVGFGAAGGFIGFGDGAVTPTEVANVVGADGAVTAAGMSKRLLDGAVAASEAIGLCGAAAADAVLPKCSLCCAVAARDNDCVIGG
ncbi:hypothetical protein BTK97_005630, partial [Burkholderia multivorans]|nr:hypothetical protein [Burkholderia multivorans]